jgi:hypothetical protein
MQIHEHFLMMTADDVRLLAADLTPIERAFEAARIVAQAALKQIEAADLLGVHVTKINRATRILQRGIPELIAGVLAGSITLGAGHQLALLPDDEQRAAVASGAASTVAEQLRRNRWQSHRTHPMSVEQKTQQRREQIRELAAAGHDSAQIAAAVGITRDTCRNILRQEHIACPGDKAHGRARKHDPARILQQIVMDAENLLISEDLIDYAQLRIPPARLAEWITTLDAARDSLGSFIRKLRKEKVRDDHEAA